MNKLTKAERLKRKLVIESLFGGNGKSFPVFPLRVVFMTTEREMDTAAVRVLVSVSKRCFKRAVKRNRVKRQIREAYRKNKQLLYEALEGKTFGLVLAFIWLDKELHPSEEIEQKMKMLLHRVIEKMPVYEQGGKVDS